MSLINRRFLSVNLSIKGIANEPEASPTTGIQYIVGNSPTGAFASASANSIARYNGSTWNFITPSPEQLEVLNTDTGEILAFNGSSWSVIAKLGGASPILGIVATGTELPEEAVTGDKFLNISTGKLYTATDVDTWDLGTNIADGDRYGSNTDAKIYESQNGTITGQNLADGTLIFSKGDNLIYAYNATTSQLVAFTGGSSSSGGSNIFTEVHTLTENEITAKSFTLSHSIASGTETSIILAVCGIIQTPGVDFTASGNSISWSSKGLEDINLLVGDVFIVSYQI